jgi:hypothetical protein
MEVEPSLEVLLAALVILTALTILLYLGYSGLFTPVSVSTLEPASGAITLAYKTFVGPYKDAGWMFTESYCLMPDRDQLGIYYDDPEGVPANELRCAVGPVLARGEEQALPEEMEKMRENGFKIVHLPKSSYVVTATFPFTTTFSIYIAIYRVYPRLRDYIAERRLCAYPALELYTDSNIVFSMPLSRQDEFFVPEFQEDEVSIATTDLGGKDGEVENTREDSNSDSDSVNEVGEVGEGELEAEAEAVEKEAEASRVSVVPASPHNRD